MKTFSPRHLLTASALAVTVGLGYAAAQDAQPKPPAAQEPTAPKEPKRRK